MVAYAHAVDVVHAFMCVLSQLIDQPNSSYKNTKSKQTKLDQFLTFQIKTGQCVHQNSMYHTNRQFDCSFVKFEETIMIYLFWSQNQNFGTQNNIDLRGLEEIY